MTHIMLDLETWGLTPGSDIRSIGAVVFDPVAGWITKSREFPESERQFYIATENPAGRMRNGIFETHLATGKEDYRKYALTRDPQTVKWWNEQSEEAQKAFANPIDLREALANFGLWFNEATDHQSEGVRLWVNGPHFDIAILAAAYRAVDLPEPWHYRAPRDMRTIADAAGMTKDEFCNYGEAHNALDDAIAQAMTVCEAYKRLRLQK